MIARAGQPPPPGPIQLGKLLLVEGNSPMHFFEALLKETNLDGIIEIRNYGGINDLPKYLKTLAATSEFVLVDSLAVIRDAEGDFAGAKSSVSGAIGHANLRPVVRTSVFILPDNLSNDRMLETLCLRSIASTPALACVDSFFDCVNRSLASALVDDLEKRRVQAYLAVMPNLEQFPGRAAYKGIWDWKDPVFQPLIQFLKAI